MEALPDLDRILGQRHDLPDGRARAAAGRRARLRRASRRRAARPSPAAPAREPGRPRPSASRDRSSGACRASSRQLLRRCRRPSRRSTRSCERRASFFLPLARRPSTRGPVRPWPPVRPGAVRPSRSGARSVRGAPVSPSPGGRLPALEEHARSASASVEISSRRPSRSPLPRRRPARPRLGRERVLASDLPPEQPRPATPTTESPRPSRARFARRRSRSSSGHCWTTSGISSSRYSRKPLLRDESVRAELEDLVDGVEEVVGDGDRPHLARGTARAVHALISNAASSAG